MSNRLIKYYWDETVIRAFVLQQPEVIQLLQVALRDGGERYRLFTSVLSPALILADPKLRMQVYEKGVAITIEHLCKEKDAKLERVACHEMIADRVGALLREANREEWELPIKTAIELATADWLGVEAYETLDAKELSKFSKILDSHPRITLPLDSDMRTIDVNRDDADRDDGERRLPFAEEAGKGVKQGISSPRGSDDAEKSAPSQGGSEDGPAKHEPGAAYLDLRKGLGLGSAGPEGPPSKRKKSK